MTVIRDSTTRQKFGIMEELSIPGTEILGTAPEFDIFVLAEKPRAGPRTVSDYLAKLYERVYERLCEPASERLHTRLCERVRSAREDLLLTCLASWGRTEEDVGIRWLSALKSEPSWSSEAASLLRPCLYHDLPDALSRDLFQWFYCQDAEGEYPEWEWIQAHQAWLRDKYAGLWIALLGNRMVAVADSELGVLRQAAGLGYENTFTFYVPSESEPAVVVVAR